MADRRRPIARVRLARSTPRLLAFPTLLVLAGLALAAFGLVGAPMPAGAAAVAIGAAMALLGLAWAARAVSVRLDVEEAAIRVHWLGGERRYTLVAGPVTRVRFRGENPSRLRARTGIFGWQLGEARLRDEEEIHIVRLAPTATAILVPTEKGRLAIAPAEEDELLDALTRAAHARQQQEVAAPPAEPEPVAEPPQPSAVPEPVPESEPRPLTGIERAMLEERLAAEREAAAAAAQAGADAPPPPATEPVPAPVVAPEPPPAPRQRRAPLPRLRIGRVRRPGPRAAVVLLPLAGAGVAWGVGLVTGRMPEEGSDLGRLTSLALVLAGPATSVGAIMALAWWPRIAVVVVAGGLVASAFVGRALLG